MIQKNLQELHKRIQQPIPSSMLSKDPRGNLYIGSAKTLGMLNSLFPFAWKSEVKEVILDEQSNYTGKKGEMTRVVFSAIVRVSIKPSTEWLNYEDIGVHTAFSKQNQSDQAITLARKGCVSRAITRCCRQFGFGLNLYDKDGKLQELRDTIGVFSTVSDADIVPQNKQDLQPQLLDRINELLPQTKDKVRSLEFIMQSLEKNGFSSLPVASVAFLQKTIALMEKGIANAKSK